MDKSIIHHNHNELYQPQTQAQSQQQSHNHHRPSISKEQVASMLLSKKLSNGRTSLTLDKYAKLRGITHQQKLPVVTKKASYFTRKFGQSYFYKKFKQYQKVLYLVLEEPSSSNMGRLIFIIIIMCITFTTINSIISSTKYDLSQQDNPDDGSNNITSNIEYGISIFFVLEYFLRLISCTAFGEKFLSYIKRPIMIIDFISVLPFVIEHVFGLQYFNSLKIVRIMRLIKIMRVLKFTRYLKGSNIFWDGIESSIPSFGFLLLALIVANIMFAVPYYYAEYNIAAIESGDTSIVTTIPDSMWWALTTMTTVGYGDKYPHSYLGKIISSLTALTGMFIIALPVAILGVNFQKVYEENLDKGKIKRLKKSITKDNIKKTEDEREMIFMNERIKAIAEGSASISALLKKSDELYNIVEKEIKVLYSVLYAAEVKEEESVMDEINLFGMSNKIKIMERLQRAKKKIKLMQLFKKSTSTIRNDPNTHNSLNTIGTNNFGVDTHNQKANGITSGFDGIHPHDDDSTRGNSNGGAIRGFNDVFGSSDGIRGNSGNKINTLHGINDSSPRFNHADYGSKTNNNNGLNLKINGIKNLNNNKEMQIMITDGEQNQQGISSAKNEKNSNIITEFTRFNQSTRNNGGITTINQTMEEDDELMPSVGDDKGLCKSDFTKGFRYDMRKHTLANVNHKNAKSSRKPTRIYNKRDRDKRFFVKSNSQDAENSFIRYKIKNFDFLTNDILNELILCESDSELPIKDINNGNGECPGNRNFSRMELCGSSNSHLDKATAHNIANYTTTKRKTVIEGNPQKSVKSPVQKFKLINLNSNTWKLAEKIYEIELQKSHRSSPADHLNSYRGYINSANNQPRRSKFFFPRELDNDEERKNQEYEYQMSGVTPKHKKTFMKLQTGKVLEENEDFMVNFDGSFKDYEGNHFNDHNTKNRSIFSRNTNKKISANISDSFTKYPSDFYYYNSIKNEETSPKNYSFNYGNSSRRSSQYPSTNKPQANITIFRKIKA